MNYDKIKDCIVVIPSKAREHIDEIEIAEKAKKCFTVAKDSVKKADDYIGEPTVLGKFMLAFASFFSGIFVGLITAKFQKKLGWFIAALSGAGLLYLVCRYFSERAED